MVDKLFLLLFLCGAFGVIFVSAKVYETEDAIIIEGKTWKTSEKIWCEIIPTASVTFVSWRLLNFEFCKDNFYRKWTV